MSLKAKIASDAEIARTTVINSALDDEVKHNLVTFITLSTIATNGITTEEKIQSLTEIMASFATAIATFMCKTNSRIDQLSDKVDKIFPKDKVDLIKLFEHMLAETEQYRKVHNITPKFEIDDRYINDIINGITSNTAAHTVHEETESKTIVDKIFQLLTKPYAWIFGCVVVCSPYALDILKAILAHFGG